ncbi:sensor histidine kinase [Auraticoccus monumenti]|uniref:histidine kinase n=1 Tax=Auraticoccus monumenti TaxID=675864 RepID=A0A1G7AUW6_9ACTN|nr:histidine kinase N-terminal domain-containing protein [Auraticoccus monumenti]SDE18593.1 Two-component sensor histidine kinase, contains HisKA and HATPase domains [Auraticoccus monumenti]
MATMGEIFGEHTALLPEQTDWLRRLTQEWHLIADLSFADLVLWVPDRDPNMMWAAAQVRPVTGPTCLLDDLVGDLIAYTPENLVSEAYMSGVMTRTSDNKLQAGVPVDVVAIPVVHDGETIAVLERSTNQLGVRSTSALEEAYLEIADVLCDMVQLGTFPMAGVASDPTASPRVGDGLIRVSADGDVTYASPNAVSIYRRMGFSGDLVDEDFFAFTDQLVTREGGSGTSVSTALDGIEAAEFDLHAGGSDLRARILPLVSHGEPDGLLVLCRDVTELRERERRLVGKDATIREIHHRVKNNLQTVAALLRMQARRIPSVEAKEALAEAMSRVAAIASVHETLSQSYDDDVDFDDVADRVLRIVGDVAATHGQVQASRVGSFGMIPAAVATSLSLVMTELCQNAVEHGLDSTSGQVVVEPRRVDHSLELLVSDAGVGLPEGFELASSKSLGLSIVSTLVRDLGGEFTLGPNPAGRGSTARVLLPLDDPPSNSSLG